MKKFFKSWMERRKQAAEMRREKLAEDRRRREEREREARRREEERQRKLRTIPEIFTKMLKALAEGKLPNTGDTQKIERYIKLGKTEILLMTVRECVLHEGYIYKEYVGRAQASSVRVMKGLSVRIPGNPGTPVERHEYREHGPGTFLMTQKGLYYFDDKKTLRAPFNRLHKNTEPGGGGLGDLHNGLFQIRRIKKKETYDAFDFGEYVWVPKFIEKAMAYLPNIPASAAKETNLVDLDTWVPGQEQSQVRNME